MLLRFGRRSQEVDAWPNIDSFLRRFNDPETAETFNESAAPATASAPHAIDSFGDAFTFFCARRKLPRQLLLLLLRPAISIRFQHFTAAVVVAVAVFCASFCRVHNLAALSCQHILCASETGCGCCCCQIIKTPTGNVASGSSTGTGRGRVSFIRSLKTES